MAQVPRLFGMFVSVTPHAPLCGLTPAVLVSPQSAFTVTFLSLAGFPLGYVAIPPTEITAGVFSLTRFGLAPHVKAMVFLPYLFNQFSLTPRILFFSSSPP